MTLFGISLLRLSPALWRDAAQAAEELGFESVWMSEHLVLPTRLDGANYPDGKVPINPATPFFDVMVYLSTLAASTSTLRVGTYVYQLALRHPFVAARAVATLDEVSGGRVELGVGAGWMPEEWAAAGVNFAGRGRRLDEAITICRRLWSEPAIAHTGEFFAFPEVSFEPKPPQGAGLPIHVGGESSAALHRAVRVGHGWIGMHHTPGSAEVVLARLRAAEAAAGAEETTFRRPPLHTTVAAQPGPDIDVDNWRRTGVARVVVAPWTSSRDALDGMRAFAARHLSG